MHAKNLKAEHPIGEGVPVVTLSDPFEVAAMMRMLGLEERFHRDMIEFVFALDKAPHATMLLLYPSDKAEVVAVVSSEGAGSGKVRGKVTFVFHRGGYSTLAKDFAQGYFAELQAGLERIDGAKRWEPGA